MKRAYKLTPVSMYDVHGLEKWLEKLAAQGLFLKKYRPLVCTFLRDEPKHVRYRLEPCRYGIDGPPDDMLDLYQEYGWQHVGGVNHEMVIFSCSDPHAPEPHTDPDIQLEQWNELAELARKNFRDYLLLDLGALAAMVIFFLWGGTPLTKLLNFRFWFFPYILVINCLPQTLIALSRSRELAAVIREMEGLPKKRQFWFPSRQFFSWMGFLFLLFLIVFFPVSRYLSERDWTIPELVPLSVTDTESGNTVGGTDLAVNVGFSPLCWRQREFWDFSSAENRMLYLEVCWFDFPDWLSFLAVPAAKDLLTDSMKLNDRNYPWRDKEAASWTTRDWPGSGADWLSVAESEDGAYHTAAAALGSKVVLVRYIGSGELSGCLNDIVAMIK